MDSASRGDSSMAAEVECSRPVMCLCTATKFRPTLLSLISAYECIFCDGWGWVEEHEFTGDGHNCTVCGWSRVGHWDYEQDREEL